MDVNNNLDVNMNPDAASSVPTEQAQQPSYSQAAPEPQCSQTEAQPQYSQPTPEPQYSQAGPQSQYSQQYSQQQYSQIPPQQPYPPYPPQPPVGNAPNYVLWMALGIFQIVLCCCLGLVTMITGILTVVFATNANNAYKNGRTAESESYMRYAMIANLVGWGFFALGIGASTLLSFGKTPSFVIEKIDRITDFI